MIEVPYDLAARRLEHLTGTYDWHLGAGLHEGRPPTIVLRHEHRPDWPRLAREAGVTHLSPILFTQPEDRLLFALDCDL